jgi:hypothetical protein
MVNRPRAHVLGDLAVSRLVQKFTARGWTCERLSQDYGEDLIVRIFESGDVTPYFFFVQSKSTDNIKKYENKFGEYRYPFNPRHVEQWLSYRQPVIATLYDSKSGRIFWQDIQQYMEHTVGNKKKAKPSILFTSRKMINRTGLELIAAMAIYRHDIFDEINTATRQLREVLEEHYGLKIEFDPQGVIIHPTGKFIPKEPEEKTVTLFGRTLAKMKAINSRLNLGDSDNMLENVVRVAHDFFTPFMKGSKLRITDSEGTVLREFLNYEEFAEYLAARSTSPY